MVVIRKPNHGCRKKIEMKKIEVTDKRQVTFSKRKAGIFSKAGQLCTLTGAEAAIVVFSPQGSRVYSYGHPSADTIIDRYFTGDDRQPSVVMDADEYNKQYEEASKVLEMEKKRGAMIEEKKKASDYNVLWWEDEPMEGLEREEQEQYMASLKEFRKNLALRIQELSGMNMNNNYYATSSSMPYFAMDSSLVNGAVPVNNALTYNQPAFFGGDTRVQNLGFGYGHGKI